MTQLLEQALREAQELSHGEQDSLAQRTLTELSDEEEWANWFDRTTEEQWEELARQAAAEISAGQTEPLEDLAS